MNKGYKSVGTYDSLRKAGGFKDTQPLSMDASMNNEQARQFLKRKFPQYAKYVDDFIEADYNMNLSENNWVNAFLHELAEEGVPGVKDPY